jgi:hypothetical protein
LFPGSAPTQRMETRHGGVDAGEPLTPLLECPTGVVLEQDRSPENGDPSGHSPGPTLANPPSQGGVEENIATVVLTSTSDCAQPCLPCARGGSGSGR